MKKFFANPGYIEGTISVLINILLFLIKIWIGVKIGSIAMTADAWHTLSDTLTSVVVVLGFWLSSRPQDKKHPFGHGRAEVIAALVIAVLLGVVGANFMKDSIVNLIKQLKAPKFTELAIWIFAISAIVKEALARYSFWLGKKFSSSALIGDGWHHRADAIASIMIVLGCLLGTRFWWIDSAMGIIVSGLILWAAFDVARQAANTLMGEEVNPALEQSIQQTINSVAPDIPAAHHIHIHRYGEHREITLHINMPGKQSLKRSHEIATKIEKKLRELFKIESTVHMEPLRSEELPPDPSD